MLQLLNFASTSDDKKTVLVHADCRRDFTNFRRAKKRSNDSITEQPVQRKKMRTSFPEFDWETYCYFCTEEINFKKIRRRRIGKYKEFSKGETVEIRFNVIEACDRRNDDWSDRVKMQMLSCLDLVAVGAVYHCKCRIKFMNGAAEKFTIGPGRLRDEIMREQFEDTCKWLDESCEFVKLNEAYG